MNRRNFLKALSGVLLTPLLALLPKSQAPDSLVIDWRDSIRPSTPMMGKFIKGVPKNVYISHQDLPGHYRTISEAEQHIANGDTIYILNDGPFIINGLRDKHNLTFIGNGPKR